MEETWKDVVGYEQYFKVSSTGKIFSKRSNKELKQHLHKNGYYTFSTRLDGRNGVAKCFRVHILVATAFIKNYENKPTVNHINGIKTDNNSCNLEWSSYTEQMIHARDTGLLNILSGTATAQSKLSENDILFIRKHYKSHSRDFGTRALGVMFGVSHSTISAVVRNITYKS